MSEPRPESHLDERGASAVCALRRWLHWSHMATVYSGYLPEGKMC